MLTAGAKALRVAPIAGRDAGAFVRRVHYSGTVVSNSQLHLGVFLGDRLEGVMQFGPSMDKGKLQGLVPGTQWNEFIELNRMAFSEALPRNSESRALGVAMRLLRRHYPHLKWVVSFADGTQCGDGTIYRAAGWLLTKVERNDTILEFPWGLRVADVTLKAHWDGATAREVCAKLGVGVQRRTRRQWLELGARPVHGHQLRYVCLLQGGLELVCPVLPYSAIAEAGAGMYRGQARVAAGAEARAA